MKYMLETVEIISGITNLDAKSVTLFLIELSNAFNINIGPKFQKGVDKIFNFYRDAPISHEEFIQAFKNSKRLLISNRMEPSDYLIMLKLGLTKGVSPEDINDFIQEKITTRIDEPIR